MGWRRSGASFGLGVALSLVGASVPMPSRGGAFLFAGETYGIEIVTHPTGYDGTGGPLGVSVCIDPEATDAATMETPVQNAVNTFNARMPRTGNVLLGSSNDVPAGRFDFESVMLHELGHCLGLSHPNLGSESGLSGSNTDFTRSTDGANEGFDLDVGADARIGSADDVRPDDVGLNYFRMSNNDPFSLAETVDATTYSRAAADLPGTDLFASGASREIAADLGLSDTEAVMHQGQYSDEAQRDLGHDDVATLRYAESGLDEAAGTADDYSLTLEYAGLTGDCDIVIESRSSGSFARCSVGGTFRSATHLSITTALLTYNTSYNWHFNEVPNAPAEVPALSRTGVLAAAFAIVSAGLAGLLRRRRRAGCARR